MDVSFDKADVEALGAKPWTHRDEFAAEVDTEHMADTASIFARAAHSARDAGDLAERATEIGQQAGALNGSAFVEDDRIDSTAAGLQGNGEGIDKVVGMLVKAMNRAMQAREEVDAQIDGGDGGAGMQQVLQHNSAAAVQTWERAQQFFAAQAPPSPITPQPFLGAGVPRFTFNNVEYEGVPSAGAWTAPPSLPGDIRDTYLNMTGDEASWADEEITDAIRQYRQKLAQYGAELEEAGYDTSEGPLGIWHSDEMAAFNGEQVKKLLSEGDPDPELLSRYTAGLDSLADDLDDKDGAKQPSAEQQAYLNAFFGKVGTEDLLAAGRLKGPAFEPFQEALANGVIAASTGPQPVSTVKEFFEKTPISDEGTGQNLKLQADRFNDFGALMSHGTVTPSDAFSTSLINASIDAQKDYWNKAPLGSQYPLDGAHELLQLAAANDGAAATFLGDENQVKRLLDPTLAWQDNGRAVGDLMRAGTLPDGETFTAAERDKLKAGYTVMQYIADNSEAYVDNSFSLPSRAEEAFTDIASHPEYLKNLSAATNGDSYVDRVAGDRFQFSADDRSALFSALLHGEEENADSFRSAVDEYTGQRAHEVFDGRAGTGTPSAEIEQLGELNAAVINAELDAAYQADKRDDESAQQNAQALRTALALGTEATPARLAKGFGLADGLSNLVSDPEPTAERNDEMRRFLENREGGMDGIQRIYDAARDAEYPGISDTKAAEIIPRAGEGWNLSPGDWKLIDTYTAQNRQRAVENALGDLTGNFLDGWTAEIDRGAVRNNFEDQEEISEAENGGRVGDWMPR
ncbi:hypothetical protein [Streptomyces sp. RFCAC02]|uniref:hypothetical protein n=1 Tax=Streptomyces sp. RFCAC02 TaxID=2499143 RepID=UPI00101FB2AE|nr:hypothetical protein [Streptomyces sp. RFCAC02]